MNKDMHRWLEHLEKVRHLAKATIHSYGKDLDAWCDFLAERDLDDKIVTVNEARTFMACMSLENLSTASINRRFSALNGYYQWRCRHKLSDENPFRKNHTLRQSRMLPEYLTYEEIEKMIECTRDDFAGIRDRVLFELLYSTGCRIAELCMLNVSDIKRSSIMIRGKGNRQRMVFIGSKADEALREYCPLREKKVSADNSDSCKALILSTRGYRLTPRGARYIIDRYSKMMGLDKKISPHTFRHSFATHILNEGANIRLVQEMLGHQSLSTTQIYTHTGIERIKQVYRKSHPHGRKVSGGNKV